MTEVCGTVLTGVLEVGTVLGFCCVVGTVEPRLGWVEDGTEFESPSLGWVEDGTEFESPSLESLPLAFELFFDAITV